MDKNKIEDYIIEQTTEYYNGIKELANDTMNKLQSCNMEDNDLKSCKEKINYILNMENDLIQLKFGNLMYNCISKSDSILKLDNTNVNDYKLGMNNDTIKNCDESIKHFCNTIDSISVKYNKNFCKELVDIMHLFWKIQYSSITMIEQLPQELFEDYQFLLSEEQRGKKENMIKTISEYTNKFANNAINTLRIIFKKLKDNLLNGHISEMGKIMINEIIPNIEQAMEIRKQIEDDIKSENSTILNSIELQNPTEQTDTRKNHKENFNTTLQISSELFTKTKEELTKKLELLKGGIPVEQLTASLDLRNKNKDLSIEQIKEKLQQNDNNK